MHRLSMRLNSVENKCINSATNVINKARGLSISGCPGPMNHPLKVRTTHGDAKTVHYLCGGCSIFLNSGPEGHGLLYVRRVRSNYGDNFHECRHCDQPWGAFRVGPIYHDPTPDLEIDAYRHEIDVMKRIRRLCGTSEGPCWKADWKSISTLAISPQKKASRSIHNPDIASS